jgi:hypothetical protein
LEKGSHWDEIFITELILEELVKEGRVRISGEIILLTL